ncbi:MAG: hypothetical protein CL607_28350 [Anaerolineaceae bacterium]|nr:hypothetical protein [Anaerolineaceae bacterium]
MTQAIHIDYQLSGAAGVCRPILLALPAWFGIESANQHYLEYVDANPTFIAYNGDTATGFLSLAQPFPQSAEIYVMAVHPEHHRQGVGRALVAAAEAHLRQQDARFFTGQDAERHTSQPRVRTDAAILPVDGLCSAGGLP